MPQTALAAKHNVSQSQISRILSQDEMQAIVHQGITDQVSMIPSANEVIQECINGDDKKMALDASKVVFKNTGITPSHTQININKMFNQDNRTQAVQIDGLQEFMAFKYRDEDDDKVIDVTPDEERLQEGKDKATTWELTLWYHIAATGWLTLVCLGMLSFTRR